MPVFGGGYWTRQSFRGTILHAALIAAATTAAIHFPRSAARAFRSEGPGLFSELRGESARQAPAPAATESADPSVESATPAALSDPQPRRNWSKGSWGKKAGSLRISIGAGFGFILCVLSIGTIGGAPHGGNPAQGISAGSPWPWPADALWLVGYNPYARVIEAEISRKPAGWTETESDLSHVQGVNLNGFRLRYMQGYSAFLVKARLRQADLSY